MTAPNSRLTPAVRTLAACAALGLLAGAPSAQPLLWDPAAGGNAHFYERMAAPEGITWEQTLAAAIKTLF